MQMIEEVMTRRVVTVSALTPALVAKEIAAKSRIRHLLVTRRTGLHGVLCVCDLRTLAEQEAVESCMARPVVTISPEATLSRCADVMRDQRVGCLPVTSGSQLVGIVTRGDLWRLGFSDEQLGILRCASCGYCHNVIARPGAPEVGFCLFCRERSVPPDEDTELGGSG